MGLLTMVAGSKRREIQRLLPLSGVVSSENAVKHFHDIRGAKVKGS